MGAPQHRPTGGLEYKDSLKTLSTTPPPHAQCGYRCGMETSPTSWETLCPQGGAPGRGLGKGPEEAAANFPLPCCLHPSDELAPGFIAFSPGQVCQDRLAAFCQVPAGSQGTALLCVDTRGELSGSTGDPLGVGGRVCSSHAGQGGRATTPLGYEACRSGLVDFHPSISGAKWSVSLGRKDQVRP